MTRLQKLKKLLIFHYFSKTSNGYLIDGMVFIDSEIEYYKLIKRDERYILNLEDISHLKGLIESSVYENILPEDYHLRNNLGKFSESDLYFLVAEDTVKIGFSTDIDTRLASFKTSISCDFDFYYIERKGFLEKTMHHAFSDFHKKGEWFYYNERFERFIKSNALKVNQDRKEICPYIDSYILDFGAYNGYDIKELIHIDNKYCQSLAEHKSFSDKISRFIKCNKK